jgi:invasion protein IalB
LRIPPQSCIPFVLLSGFLAAGSRAQSPIEDLLRSQQPWQIKCIEKGCIASVDILRGESGQPPDPKDATQYVSVAVAADYSDDKPQMIMFEVDPKADKEAGIDLLFAGTTADDKRFKTTIDPSGPVHLTFRSCNETECVAVLGSAKPDDAALKQCADMIARMQSEDHLFLAYRRNDHVYSTAISLSLFKEAYGKLLARVSAGPENRTPKVAVP